MARPGDLPIGDVVAGALCDVVYRDGGAESFECTFIRGLARDMRLIFQAMEGGAGCPELTTEEIQLALFQLSRRAMFGAERAKRTA